MLNISKKTDPRLQWDMLWRRKWVVIAATAVGVLAGLYRILTSTPMYDASATILLRALDLTSRTVERFAPEVRAWQDLATLQAQILSPEILTRVIDQVGLKDDPEMRPQAEGNRQENPELSLDEIKQMLVIQRLKEKVIKITPTGDNIVKISAEHKNPRVAYEIVKNLVDVFIEHSRRTEQGGVKSGLAFGREQMLVYKRKLEEAESRLQQFTAGVALEAFNASRTSGDHIAELRLIVASTAAQLEQEKAALQAAQTQLAAQNVDPPKLTSLLLEQLHQHQLDKLALLMNLLSQSSAGEAEVIRLNTEIKNLDVAVQNEMQRLLAEQSYAANRSSWFEREIEGWRVQFLEKKKAQLEQMSRAYQQSQKASASNAPAYEVTETSLKREVDQARELYHLFLHQAQGSEMQAALQNAQNEYHYRILEPAQIPLHSNSMSNFKKLLIAGAAGFIFGLLLAFRLEGFKRTFTTVEEVSEQMQLPVVGLMPKLQKKEVLFELDGKDTLEVQRVTTRIMKHLPAGNVQLDKFPADKQRTLLITSSIDTEGKSTFAAHLAANLAAFQRWPVLLIDADLRRPEQHRLVKIENQAGLVNLLEDHNALPALLASTQYENLSVLPSGRLQCAPLELFTSKRFATALEELKKEFAFIIIDAP